MKHLHNIGVASGNLLSWFAAIWSLSTIQQVAGILAGLGSFVVSIATIVWIRKQANALDNKLKERE